MATGQDATGREIAVVKPSPIEQVAFDGQVMAIIIRADFQEPGIHFFTPVDYSQQLGFMSHPAGKAIAPHFHNVRHREIRTTQEALFIRKGRLRVDFYTTEGGYLESRVLGTGDVVLLVSGGHGFKALEDVEMIEIKQGPFLITEDKSLLTAASEDEITLP